MTLFLSHCRKLLAEAFSGTFLLFQTLSYIIDGRVRSLGRITLPKALVRLYYLRRDGGGGGYNLRNRYFIRTHFYDANRGAVE